MNIITGGATTKFATDMKNHNHCDSNNDMVSVLEDLMRTKEGIPGTSI